MIPEVKLPPGPLAPGDRAVIEEGLRLVTADQGVYVEIGSLVGRSSVIIGQEVKKRGGKLYCIDVWDSGEWESVAKEIGKEARKYPTRPPKTYETFLENIYRCGLGDVVKPMMLRSDKAFFTWSQPICFIFIDGCHEYDFVKRDALWKRFVEVGGVMVFHDYHPNWPGVIRAVDEVMRTDSCFEQVARGNQCIAFRRVSND